MFPGQFQVQQHRHTTTAHLAQTMTLLSLTIEELGEQIEKELSANPALELLEERRCPTCHRPLPERGKCSVCSKPLDSHTEDPVVFISPKDSLYSKEYDPTREYSDEPAAPMVDDLPTYVLKQIASELETNDRQIAAYLLTHLDEDGLLTANIMEVANYYHVPITKVETIQNIIRHADPYGVGSSNSKDALLVQLDLLGENNTIPAHTKEIIESGLDLLSKHQYSEIAKKIGIPVKKVQEAAAFISDNLNPFPARSHWGDARQSTSEVIGVYRHPDIIINTIEEAGETRLVIEILLPISGTLQVNHIYKQAIKESEGDAKVEMKGDLERASLFVKCIQQRNNTLVRLLGKIANIQKEFILSGEKQLKPVTRASIAKELGVHESTISRAVANKSMQLPNKRIVPLSMFFDRSLNVRTVLKDIIENEMHPLSDFELMDLLGKQGFPVARRTVAKYRAMEGILPAHLRQEAS